jgi:hypothetical protein
MSLPRTASLVAELRLPPTTLVRTDSSLLDGTEGPHAQSIRHDNLRRLRESAGGGCRPSGDGAKKVG